jgi:hypothetical protein
MGDESKTQMDWRAALPDDLKAHESLKDFKDPVALAKSYVETKALVGASIRVPGENAGDVEKKAFFDKLRTVVPQLQYIPDGKDEHAVTAFEEQMWARLGKPNDPKQYAIPKELEPLAAGLPIEEMREAAKRFGWTQKQFAEYAKTAIEATGEKTKKHKADVDALRKEWGAAYGEKLANILDVAKRAGYPEETLNAIRNEQMNSGQLKAFDNIAKSMATTAPVGTQGGPTPHKTKPELMMEKQEILNNEVLWHPEKNPQLAGYLRKRMVDIEAELLK